ncbi:aminotransferase class V-fold PLP-dependent enzyme [Candidatus Woesearchaeota archaeon]|nr:aminotransferase class V-fold PLP-dependent enzyme [Candidatus Woesearchaeota archaeon]
MEVYNLFPERALSYVVELQNGKRVRYVNLDNAATTIPFSSALERIASEVSSYGSVHRGAGQKSKVTTDNYEAARKTIADFVGASSENYVIFTKNTTESVNLAATLWKEFNGKVLVSDIEHSSNLLPWLQQEGRENLLQYKTTADGRIDLAEIEKILQANDDIKLLAITGSSNITGYKPDIHAIAELCHRYKAKIFVDACQLLQHKQLDILSDIDPRHIDFVAFSGHKMYAPFGIGVLVGPKEFFDASEPYQIGGGNLPYIRRDLEVLRYSTVQTFDPGTPNAFGVIALAESIQKLQELGVERIAKYEHSLVERAFDGLQSIDGVRLYVQRDALGVVIPFEIDGFHAKLTAEILAQEYGIGTRAGSFCTYELVRKLKGTTVKEDRIIAEEVKQGITKNIPAVVRASFGLSNTLEDVERLVGAVAEITQNGASFYEIRYKEDDTNESYTLR